MSTLSTRMVAMISIFLVGAMACQAGSGATGTVPAQAVDQPKAATAAKQTATVAGGCFWGIQAVVQHVKGVLSATSGYSGGTGNDSGYEAVESGRRGRAE